MEPADFHLIPPVTGLQKPASVASTGRREERRRRQSESSQEQENELTEFEEEVDQERNVSPPTACEDDPHSIDFRA